jgi:DNA-binding transcriptional ArsR family regulator
MGQRKLRAADRRQQELSRSRESPHENAAEARRRSLPETGYVVSVFKALADETRVTLLFLISQSEWSVRDLGTALGTSVSNVSHHLRLLRVMRLVRSRKEGRRVFYTLDDDHVRGLLQAVFEHASHR